jgi:hypothetical protein
MFANQSASGETSLSLENSGDVSRQRSSVRTWARAFVEAVDQALSEAHGCVHGRRKRRTGSVTVGR